MPALSELFRSQRNKKRRLRSIPNSSNEIILNNFVPAATRGISLIFTDGNKKIGLKGEILVMMNTYNLNADPSVDKKLLVYFLYELKLEVKLVVKESDRDKSLMNLINSPLGNQGR